MKKWLFIACLLCTITTTAQNQKAIPIEVNTEMFVQLVFKSPIQTFKVGLPNLVEVQSNDNTLTIQGLSVELKTNVTVKTADGLYYVFILQGTEKTPELFYEVGKDKALNFSGAVTTEAVTAKKEKAQVEDSYKSIDEKILEKKDYISDRHSADFRRVTLSLKGIYVNSDKLYFLMEIRNDSNIKYDINKLTFLTVSKKKNKKQIKAEEQEFEPLYFYKELSSVPANSGTKFVAVFNKFTLNNDKKMEINLSEKDGERVVRLYVSTKTITDAQKID